MALRAVLFDLDGTLVDSAPDLAGAANDLLERRGRAPLPLERLRPHGGSGARGMLGEAFGLKPGDVHYEALRDEFLDHYATRMLRATLVFEPVPAMLQALAQRGLAWGIVTNKAMRFAGPLTAALGLVPHAGCLVAGDTTPHTKPHPAPLLEAARRLGLQPVDCVYVGDDHRDMIAARAAGMSAWAAAWGYLGPQADPHAWGADLVLPDPLALLNRLETA
jgi:N-acetyl-D-muramate 6-phosphate phosphatase